jgi:DNA-binding MarR family transcriptional regulator
VSEHTLPDDLYALIVYLHAGSNRDLWDNLRADSLSVSQALLLDRLRAGRRPTMSQAARLIGISPAGTVRLVNDLAERGYVRRETDLQDKRSKRIVLTPRGDDAIARLHAARLDQIVVFTDGLNDVEHADLAAGLASVMTRDEISRFRPTPLPA